MRERPIIPTSQRVIKLRDYQKAAVAETKRRLRNVTGRHRRIVLCSPVGSGKTVIAAKLLKDYWRRGRSCLFLMDRVSLVGQTTAMLTKYGVPHGVLQGKVNYRLNEDVLVASTQSMSRNPHLLKGKELIIIDECHVRQSAKLLKVFMDRGISVVGLTATPFKKWMHGYYAPKVVTVATTNELLKAGWLAPVRAYSVLGVDVEGLPVASTGEWQADELSKRVIHIVGDIVRQYKQRTKDVFGGPVKTLIFSASIADGLRIVEEFRAVFPQHQWGMVHSENSQNENIELIRQHHSGEITGLVTCESLTTGYDVPDVRCLVDAHPYRKSLARVVQQYGRGMRQHPGKEYCMVLDHSLNYARFHRRVSDFFQNGQVRLEEGSERLVKEKKERTRVCPICSAAMKPTATKCPLCGSIIPKLVTVMEHQARLRHIRRQEGHISV